MATLRFHVDDEFVEIEDVPPTTTVLQWLRATGRTGTREGCAEGDCGACTVLLIDATGRLRSVNSCLLLLPQVDGLRLWTVQGLARGDALHRVQRAMVDLHGSQCGYCTPGFVMSLVEAAHRPELADAEADDWRLDDQLCGNLCRCTGYVPIRAVLRQVAGTCPDDRIQASLDRKTQLPGLYYVVGDQRFHAPATLHEALTILATRDDARVVSGATDLGLDVTQRHVAFSCLVSLDRIEGLRGITVRGERVRIGATTPLTDLERWSETGLPVLHRMLRYFGSRQIKHRATVGGNLCNASPIGDLAPVLLALDAEALIAGPDGLRRLPMDEFFVDYRRIALQKGELLVGVELDLPDGDRKLGAYKVSRRRELDISAVSAAFAVDVEDGRIRAARLAYGGMAATPVRARNAESALVGQPWSEETIDAAAAAVQEELHPLSDHRGSAWYRSTVAGNLLRGFYVETRDRPFRPLPPRHTGTVVADDPGQTVEQP
ncbi:MAG: xanthine dehydrogenase small subunit [Deltaproteobacteria bacterium]|nr:MAG: xanthine dehydrogenase small subunit [Deltaproteobacteria bacterium]